MPPVSTTMNGREPRRHSAPSRSRVTPGWSWTMAIRFWARQLKIADLPTFGRPTIATIGKLAIGPHIGGESGDSICRCGVHLVLNVDMEIAQFIRQKAFEGLFRFIRKR